MENAKQGDTVVIDYSVRIGDGTVVGHTEETGPQAIKLGDGAVFPQVEEKLTDMKVGDKETVAIECEKAFGPRREEMVIDIPRQNLPADTEPQPGMALQAQQEDGSTITLYVVSVNDQSVKADGNHPLAGQDISFDVTLREIKDAA
ncbi:FKBP-type peptidyl-prolyl cis-trans isomerase [Parasphingorhabdus sp. JC815]|uniref:FKBP-type peptidyl-prolyl cis-trans isomerase n=1 Tax=Parasphingorhabdus sp. JC815 TaxID=3232140 RepID=UPI0034589101